METTRTARFAEFLRAAVAVKTKTVSDVNKYPTVIWFSELPAGLDEIRSPLFSPNWPADDLRWLVVARVPEPNRPVPPDECMPWLVGTVLDDPAAPPTLNPHYSDTNERGELVENPPDDHVRQLWDRYVAQDWTKWAKKASIARAVKSPYQKLFATHQELQGRDDAYDVFVGVGLLDSRKDTAERLHRHLLAFPAELLLDDKTGTLTVVPSAEFVALKIELDFLPTADHARLQPLVESMQGEITELGSSLHHRIKVGSLLTRLTHVLDEDGQYIDDLTPQDAPPGRNRSSFAPAFILRPRSTRSLDELLARIQADASGEAPKVAIESTPLPWRRMMEDGRVWESERPGDEPVAEHEAGGRVYFPLPSNDEQSRIIRLANGSAGVVVQGPPGTGKSHTIANLISHYLATGQRVLVTAQSSQALQVLRDKMPVELQQLCVSLLGDTRASNKDLQQSVSGILARRQEFDRRTYERRITMLEGELVGAETRLNRLERTLQESRAAETQVLEPVAGYRGTRAQIARVLRKERSRFTWIQDPVPHQIPCPSYVFGWTKLAEYHCALDTGTRARLAREWIALPFTREGAIAAVENITKARAGIPSGGPDAEVTEPPPSVSMPALRAAEKWLLDLKKIEGLVARDDLAWMRELRTMLPGNNLVTWRTLRDEATEATNKLTDAVISATVKVEVQARSVAEARSALTRLSRHYASGGKRRAFMVIKPGVVKETEWVEQAVFLEGGPVRTFEDVNRARQALAGWASFEAAWAVWSRWPSNRSGSLRQQVALLRNRIELLDSLLRLGEEVGAVPDEMRPWLAQRIEAGNTTADLLLVVRRRLSEGILAEALLHRDDLLRQLRIATNGRDVVPAVVQLSEALAAEDVDGVSAALTGLADEAAQRELQRHYLEFISSVRAVAPRTADVIVAEEGTDAWRSRFAGFEAGWRHRCAQSWLDLILSDEKIEAIHRAARDERLRMQDTLSELTAERAWLGALERLHDLHRASLVAWAKAVSNIPATGLSVFRKRAVAQALLGKCLESIPAWVVSLGRLYETVEAKPGLFDVAIVDEASQCWLDSLVLLYLAKQVIIVGDDKQISPTMVGVGDGQIAQLASAFLPDFQFRGSFTIDSSLFDHAQRYLSAGVPLREHFRCVPEIIRFSNELCYSGNPLIPLRQVGKNRLEPLKTTYLPDGLRRGDVNDGEALAIVDAIENCHLDPAYEEADFGVMCLQGDDQAARIQQLLIERLGPTVFTQRKLRCGNPYAFQGDERDVMFISMVAAPNATNATLTTLMYQQRFNVAMSRARDQAWLFHSIQEDELGANCLRRRVLEFFKQPPDLTIQGSPIDIPSLQVAAKRAERMTERPPKPFDSWFELDVALALTAQGYTLSAQVEVAKKRIDLVVEGDDGVRLAVECDGEAWHGPEQYADDVFRQRQLERAGWRFVRVRESLFYADEEKAMGEVIAACEELDIETANRRTRTTPAEKPADAPERDDREERESNLDSNVAGNEELDQRSGPFTGYGTKHYPDPRTAPIANVREAVLDIVKADGPLPKASIYRLYRDGCPRVERAGKSLRQTVNKAVYALESAGLVVSRDEGRRREPSEIVVKIPSQPWVDDRPVGARAIEDVPLSELASALRVDNNGLHPQAEADRLNLYREVAQKYDVRRLTANVVERFELAQRIASDDVEQAGNRSRF